RLLIENGGGSTVWSDADIQQWKELVGDDALNKWKSDAQASGADVDAFYDEYISLVQGYEGDYVNGMVRCADTTAQQLTLIKGGARFNLGRPALDEKVLQAEKRSTE